MNTILQILYKKLSCVKINSKNCIFAFSHIKGRTIKLYELENKKERFRKDSKHEILLFKDVLSKYVWRFLS